jgi:hypothetical protein
MTNIQMSRRRHREQITPDHNQVGVKKKNRRKTKQANSQKPPITAPQCETLEKLNLPTPLFEALKSSWVEPRAVDDDDMTKLGNFQIPRPIPILIFF